MKLNEKIQKLENELAINSEKFASEEECLVINPYRVYSLEREEEIDLCVFFDGCVADATYAGCYICPGEILKIKDIHTRLILNEIKRLIVSELIKSKFKDDELIKIAKIYKIKVG